MEKSDWFDADPALQKSAGSAYADELNADIISREAEKRLPPDSKRTYTADDMLKVARWSAAAALHWVSASCLDYDLRLRSAGAMADGTDSWLPDTDYIPKPLIEGER